ncbi:MAG: hypothetical protein HOP12_02055, partial [Candidatus Eisenbacteria bacterium]|nr:hypothetical protein [Candidatus Eisenbacteria bacterium]
APQAADARPRWISFGVLGGSTQPDAALADYQWSATPEFGWGAQALVGLGPLAGGVRGWRTGTDQALGVSGAPATTRVTETSWELVGRGRLASFWGTEMFASASAGRLALHFDPDRIQVATSGGPVEVTFAPIAEWIGGGGMSFTRPLAASWRLGLEFERRFFSLDTAHRSGTAIVESREGFGDWSARFEVARVMEWR